MCPILYKVVEAEEKEVGCLSKYATSEKYNKATVSFLWGNNTQMNKSFNLSLKSNDAFSSFPSYFLSIRNDELNNNNIQIVFWYELYFTNITNLIWLL